MTKYQSDNKYIINEWDLFEFMQACTLYFIKYSEKNNGEHPNVEERDRWMCKYAKKKFKKFDDGEETKDSTGSGRSL